MNNFGLQSVSPSLSTRRFQNAVKNVIKDQDKT